MLLSLRERDLAIVKPDSDYGGIEHTASPVKDRPSGDEE